MYTLAPDEKATPVMVYTQNGIVRGEAVSKQAVRVSTWFRTEGAPDYLYLQKAQWVTLTAGTVKPLSFAEISVPLQILIGIHILPPAQEPVDYDEREANRTNAPVSLLMGAFLVRARMRVSTQTDVRTSLSISHMQWLSIYEANISSPLLPQMPAIQSPMLMVRPQQVSFIFTE